jgi:hypothetical protein
MLPGTVVKPAFQRITASLVMIILAGTLLSGCETAQTHPDSNPDDLASVTPEHRRIIANKRIARGFTPLEVELAWGKPAYRRTSDDTQKQIWYYRRITTSLSKRNTRTPDSSTTWKNLTL